MWVKYAALLLFCSQISHPHEDSSIVLNKEIKRQHKTQLNITPLMHVQISLLFLIKPATSAAAPVDDFSPRVWRATSGYFLDERITLTSDIYLPLLRSII